MTFKHRKVTSFVLSLLVFSISLIHFPVSLQSTQAQGVPTAPVPMVGRLEVHGGKHILVDKSQAESGFTILDGQLLETSDCTSATIHLLPVVMIGSVVNEIGQIELATNTKAVINYSAGKVRVNLERGCSRLGIASTIDTTINTPDGAAMPATQQVGSDLKRAEVCFPANERRDYRPACIAPIVFGVGAAAAAGLITLALVVPCNRGQDTSLTAPTGPCL